MENKKLEAARSWYEGSYSQAGFSAQRLYPNEEFLRFMGRNFFGIPLQHRGFVQILEIGCGSCANLWAVAREGFDAYGLDLSSESIKLGKKMLNRWDVTADLRVGSMTDTPYEDGSFDVVLDVFSTFCLTEADFLDCLKEVKRLLKPGGKFFSYVPGKMSDAFQHHEPAEMLDSSTLNGIHREDSPFVGNHYPFRFVHPEAYKKIITNAGLEVCYLESVRRTYRQRQEMFEHIVIEAVNHG